MALIGIGLAGLISSFSHADDGYAAYEALTSKELANKSILAFESFTCSVWADLMGDQKASEAFLLNGYDHGRVYVQGLLNAKINQDDKRVVFQKVC